MSTEGFPRPFILQRHEDATGVSGTGVVAWGVEFPDGVVALRWNSRWPTSVVFHDRGIDAVRDVHGHGGKTEIVWLDWVPRDEWPGVAWDAVVDVVVEKNDPIGPPERFIVHRLTPASPVQEGAEDEPEADYAPFDLVPLDENEVEAW